MISHFFIDRPIFAAVLSAFLVIAGALALDSLPVAQYPDIAPPTVQVTVNYPGASAQVVADTVAAPIEQQVNGVENMLYMFSTCDNTGMYNLTITFGLGTDLNNALVAVQNRVNLAVPQLPSQVQKQGLMIKKKSPSILLAINFYSPDRRYDDIYLSNYATIHAKDEVFRLAGVSDVVFLGQRDYAIRAWVDPQKLAARGLSTDDLINAIKNQNAPFAGGQIGVEPAPGGQETQIPVSALGRLPEAEQFSNIILRVVNGKEGQVSPRILRLGDVARVELGGQRYDMSSTVDGQPALTMAVFQLPGTNALEVGDAVKKKMKELEKRFPPGLAYKIVHDTTPFIQDSIREVFKTLRDAIILVGIVVLVFLQSWRATLIPLVAVPVAIIGTFAFMAVLGFSINNISLFGLVLAIGIVVDDAIVVVENVERWLQQGLSPRDSARKAMEEVTGPVIAVALVLCAVFIPCAFISGITGEFFVQFAVTIAVSTVLSAINSLTLSPALAALLLQPHGAKPDLLQRLLNLALGWFFKSFEFVFARCTLLYSWSVRKTLRLSLVMLVLYGLLLGATGAAFPLIPQGFIPDQDQGYLLVNVVLPPGASVERSKELVEKIEKIALETEGVGHTMTVSGYSLLLNAFSSNNGSMFVILKPFPERPKISANRVAIDLRQKFAQVIREAQVTVMGAPSIQGLGNASGFKLMVEDRGDLGSGELFDATNSLLDKKDTINGLFVFFSLYQGRSPQLFADIDRMKARELLVDVSAINKAFNTQMGSYFVNNFNAFGRFWQVLLMSEPEFRGDTQNLNLIQVPSQEGKMVPLGSLVDVRPATGPGMVMRYNLYRAAPVNGVPLPWLLSSGQAIDKVSQLASNTLPPSMKTEWSELSLLQIMEGQDWRNAIVFPLAVVFVFLVLAAQYESWSLPIAVILAVPLCLLSAMAGCVLGMTGINLFTKIGMVVLVGLSSKNAILIVEFARQLREEGKEVEEATLEACRLRLRPILMTSFAFILGVLPLVLAQGAGAEMRKALGVAVFAGMLGVTFLGLLYTPVFFFLIQKMGESRTLNSPLARALSKFFLVLLTLATLGLLQLVGQLRKRRQGAP
ncbi:MAG: efflux RND transporter permease subunit [Gemmataceae bacterium]|nr:efflux RND transporter permease subunit [Gemmataceae bacterium]